MGTDKAQAAITKARNEIAAEELDKAVKVLKAKLREEQLAETALANIRREIKDLEQQIQDGNI